VIAQVDAEDRGAWRNSFGNMGGALNSLWENVLKDYSLWENVLKDLGGSVD
jgi:hypothetical protein